MAESMYMVPYTANPNVWGFNPWVRHLDYNHVWQKSGFAGAQEYLHEVWPDRPI